MSLEGSGGSDFKGVDGSRQLTPDEYRKFEESMNVFYRQQEQQREAARVAPHNNFVAAAVEAGFSETQAEFLWGMRRGSFFGS